MATRKTKKAAASSRKKTRRGPNEKRWKIAQSIMNAWIELRAEADAEVQRLRTEYQGKLDQAMGDMRIESNVPEGVNVAIRGSYFVEVKEDK